MKSRKNLKATLNKDIKSVLKKEIID